MSLKIQGDVITGNSVVANSILKTSLAAPIMVAFDVTYKCNFRCLHCFNHSGESLRNDELTNDEKVAIAKQIRDLNPYIVCLCGGETTCCDVLFDIIKILTPVVPTVNMVTNGFLITKEVAHKLKELKISNVQISLDGINSEQHDTFRGHYGAFDKALEAISYLNEVKIPVLTSFVPNKLNYKDAYQYFELCNSLKVRSARCMPFLPMGRGEDIGSHLILSKEEYYVFLQQLIKAKHDFPMINLDWGDPVDHLYRLPNNATYGVDSYSMDIKSNGDLGVSAYFPIYVGNVKKHTLKKYWDNGYNKIWGNPQIQQILSKVKNIDDFKKISTLDEYRIDLIGE